MYIVNEIRLLSRNPKKLFHVYPYISMFFSFSIALFRTLFFHLNASLKFMSLLYLIFYFWFFVIYQVFFLYQSYNTRLNVVFIPKSCLISNDFNFLLTTLHYGLPANKCSHFQGPPSVLYFKDTQKFAGCALELVINWNAPFPQLSLQLPHFLVTLVCFILSFTYFWFFGQVSVVIWLLSFLLLSSFLLSLYLLAHHYTSVLVFEISGWTIIL